MTSLKIMVLNTVTFFNDTTKKIQIWFTMFGKMDYYEPQQIKKYYRATNPIEFSVGDINVSPEYMKTEKLYWNNKVTITCPSPGVFHCEFSN